MEGINIVKICDNNLILEINYLSSELKEKIKDNLVEICHGEYGLASSSKHMSLNGTITELSSRITEDKTKRVGIVGELLLNVVIREFSKEFSNMRIISPFFNIEDRSFKKGFDIISIDHNKKIWLIESKAGEQGNFKTSTDKLCERLMEAKNDLSLRLKENNSQLWLNAIKTVHSSLIENDEKKTIMNILENNSNSSKVNDKNVILGGTVFCIVQQKINSKKIIDLYKQIFNSKCFLEIKIIAIQKTTFEDVIDFLITLNKDKNE